MQLYFRTITFYNIPSSLQSICPDHSFHHSFTMVLVLSYVVVLTLWLRVPEWWSLLMDDFHYWNHFKSVNGTRGGSSFFYVVVVVLWVKFPSGSLSLQQQETTAVFYGSYLPYYDLRCGVVSWLVTSLFRKWQGQKTDSVNRNKFLDSRRWSRSRVAQRRGTGGWLKSEACGWSKSISKDRIF